MATVGVAALASTPLLACGPFFPNRLLVQGDELVKTVPRGVFQEEVDRLVPTTGGLFRASSRTHDPIACTEAADLADLREAMAASGASSSSVARVASEYAAVRAILSAHRRAADEPSLSAWGATPRAVTSAPPARALGEPPAGLPAEFERYLRGAWLFHRGEKAAARAAWKALLDLPPGQRRYRSTWSAHMLGRTAPEGDSAEAIGWHRLVRRLAADGFRDSLGLAASSLGWEAQAEAAGGRDVAAIRLYLRQYSTGDPSALLSLRWAARRACESRGDALARVAADPVARRVVTAHIVSLDWRGGGSNREAMERFLEAIEKAGPPEVEEADRLAWAAYYAGRFVLAERWLAVASRDSAMARWIRARLLLRAGKMKDAAAELASAVRTLSPVAPALRWHEGGWASPCWLTEEPAERRIRGELGVLRLTRGQYVEALDLLLRGDYWDDAAYVAERVLTTDELNAYVDRSWPAEETVAAAAGGGAPAEIGLKSWDRVLPTGVRLRWLLGRRLTREGRGKEAGAYLPAKWSARLAAYLAALRRGDTARLTKAERADALWEAAKIARYEGMELMGTEIEPDWAIHEGAYEQSGIGVARFDPKGGELLLGSANEQARVSRHGPRPDRRFHYRHVALGLAWRATEAMPDESDRTAEVLWTAGGWIKDRDPEAADRYYKALVTRCGRTALGREAERLRWFPRTLQGRPVQSEAPAGGR